MDENDLDWASELINRFNAAALTAHERAEQGFVQGNFSPEKIRALSRGTGGYVAEVDGRRAGLALTSAPGTASGGPAGRLNELAAQEYGPAAYFAYGPVVVDAIFRRRGVLRAMFDHLRGALGERYRVGVAFVDGENPVSLTAHLRLGMVQFGSFTVGDRDYRALSFEASGA